MQENDIQKNHWNAKELLNYVHEMPSGHHAICIEILNNLWDINNMFVKCPIIKSKLADACGRKSRVEQPLHWILIH